MVKKNERIWIWLQDYEVYKAVYNETDRRLILFNSQDEIILTYIGLTAEQVQELEALFVRIGAKQIDNRTEPFTYL